MGEHDLITHFCVTVRGIWEQWCWPAPPFSFLQPHQCWGFPEGGDCIDVTSQLRWSHGGLFEGTLPELRIEPFDTATLLNRFIIKRHILQRLSTIWDLWLDKKLWQTINLKSWCNRTETCGRSKAFWEFDVVHKNWMRLFHILVWTAETADRSTPDHLGSF